MLVNNNCTSINKREALKIVRLTDSLAQTAAIDKLLKKGFSINYQFDDGNTLMHEAVLAGDSELIKILLDRDSSIEVTDVYGLRPLDYVISNTNLFEMMTAKGTSTESTIDGLPVYILEKILRPSGIKGKCTYLYVNGNQPSSQLLKWLSENGVSFAVSDYIENGSPEFMTVGPPLRDEAFYLFQVLYTKENDSKIIVETMLSASFEKKYENELSYKYDIINHNKCEFERIRGYWFEKNIFSRIQ